MGQCVGSHKVVDSVSDKKAGAGPSYKTRERRPSPTRGDPRKRSDDPVVAPPLQPVTSTGSATDPAASTSAQPQAAGAEAAALTAVVNDGGGTHHHHHPGVMESIANRLEQGSTYTWLAFSHANPHLTAQPLVRSTRQLATMMPHADSVSWGRKGTSGAAAADGKLKQSASLPAHEDPLGRQVGDAPVTATSYTFGTQSMSSNSSTVLLEAPALPVISSLETKSMGSERELANSGSTTVGKLTTSRSGDVDPRCYEADGLTPGSVFIRRPGEVRGRRFTVRACHHATILLLDLCGSVSIAQCTQCFLFVGPTVGTVELEACQDCVIATACGQVRLRQCKGVVLSLLTAALPTLENSSSIGLTPLSGWFAYNEMPLHLRAAHLSLFLNNYSTVRDLTPPPPPPRPQEQLQRRPSVGGPHPGMPPLAGAGAVSAPAKQANTPRKNFFYLDPWDFDLAVWRYAVATALSRRGISRNVSFSVEPRSAPAGKEPALRSTETLKGIGLALLSASARTQDGQSPAYSTEHDQEAGPISLPSAGAFPPAAKVQADEPVASSLSSSVAGEPGRADHPHVEDGTGGAGSSGAGAQQDRRSLHVPAHLEKQVNIDEAEEARRTLSAVPLRLLDLPVATTEVLVPVVAGKPPGAGLPQERSKAPTGKPPTTPRGLVSLQLPPLTPRCVEDVLALYTDAAVAPATLGACLIPRCFFTEKWRLKLFVVANKNGGWAIAQRIARDIELSRRQCFLEYARTVPGVVTTSPGTAAVRSAVFAPVGDGAEEAGQLEYLLSSHWHPPPSVAGSSAEGAAKEKRAGEAAADAAGDAPAEGKGNADSANAGADVDTDPASAYEHRYISLARRCGPVLLLNTAELRCTDTVMREYVAPTFYKLTEPAGVEELRSQQQKSGVAVSGEKRPDDRHTRPTEAQKALEAAELQRSVAIRRLFGEAIQRMSGQACVLLLALIAPPDSEPETQRQQATARADGTVSGNEAVASAAAAAAPSATLGEDNDQLAEPHREHEVGDDNVIALSCHSRRRHADPAAGGAAVAPQKGAGRRRGSLPLAEARRLNGLRVFQPLSREEEEELHAQSGSDNDGDSLDLDSLDGSDGVSRRSPNKRIEKKRRALAAAEARRVSGSNSSFGAGGPEGLSAPPRKAPTFTDQTVEADKSQEERAWPKCVLLNVSVPLHFVSTLQGSVFFKAAIASASTGGGHSAPSAESKRS